MIRLITEHNHPQTIEEKTLVVVRYKERDRILLIGRGLKHLVPKYIAKFE